MTFADLVKGDSLFVDANTLIYHKASNDPDFDRVPGFTRYAPL